MISLIDSGWEQIPNSKTREYFKEVVTSYINGNYRSAVVMLYSVMICDLVYKVQELAETYDDNCAKSILEKMEEKKKSAKSSDWENSIIEEISKRTNLLTVPTQNHIAGLKKDRNLSAHPAMSPDYILHRPNGETVKAHIVNMLEGLLIKPALLSKNINEEILKDVADKKDLYEFDTIGLKKYLIGKYFSKMIPSLLEKLFKLLWYKTFINEDKDTEPNRKIFFYTICILYDYNKELFVTYVPKVNTFYNFSSSQKLIQYLFRFLCRAYPIYGLLKEKEEVKSLLEAQYREGDEHVKITGWFINGGFLDHMKSVIELMDKKSSIQMVMGDLDSLSEYAENNGVMDEFVSCLLDLLSKSSNYKSSGERFIRLIIPLINVDNISENNMKKLLDIIESNKQIYGSFEVINHYSEIEKYYMKVLKQELDITKYPNLKCVIEDYIF